jgi:predicted RNA-binding Zn ribbon-like protein
MTVSWTPHRFSGGVLALDAANTVVLRGDPVRSFDRFADVAEIARFAEAASLHRSEEFNGRRLIVEDARNIAPKVLSIREATDRLFRSAAQEGSIAAAELAALLLACAAGLGSLGERFDVTDRPFRAVQTPLAFEAALAVSALSLLQPARLSRIRICANCRWLFVDGSRNRSRLWCDMAVCGNRRKAQRHYRRRRVEDNGHA